MVIATGMSGTASRSRIGPYPTTNRGRLSTSVATFSAPTDDEKRHHYLSRFVPALPGWGGMAVLDRSWYGRVLVERVEGLATVDEWSRAYEEIVARRRPSIR